MEKLHQLIIRNSYEFDRAIHLMTDELIANVMPKERLYEYLSKFFLEAAKFIKKAPDKKQGMLLFSDRMAKLLETNKETSELITIAKAIGEKNVNLEKLHARLLPFLTPTLPRAFKRMEEEKKILWINHKKVPLRKLNCTLAEMTEMIKHISQPLYYLDLTGMELTEKELIPLLQAATDLKTLVIRKIPVSNQIFNLLPNCESLTLEECGLNPLDGSIKALSNIKELHLPENGIASIPKEIGNLEKLQVLNLGHNRLESLPQSFSKLVTLKSLTLKSNRLRSFPEEIGTLEQLEVLDVSKNDIVEAPAALGTLQNLQELNLSHNWLKSLPIGLRALKNLKKIDLSYNNFNFFPDVLTKIKSLKQVSLVDNNLPGIPYELMPEVAFDV